MEIKCPICGGTESLVVSRIMHEDGAITPIVTYPCPRCGKREKKEKGE